MSQNFCGGGVKNSQQGELRMLCIIFLSQEELSKDYTDNFFEKYLFGCTRS